MPRIMQFNEKLSLLYKSFNEKFEEQFEFKIQDVTFEKIVIYLNKPKDPSSLAVTRVLFGLAMLFDIPDERGGAIMERRWDSKLCRFPLLPFLQALPMPYMAIVYAILWLGALGIMLGYKYKMAAAAFVVCYWYLFLIEKSYWNNHSYLFGLVGLLLACTDADCYWSLDAYIDPTKRKDSVPYWNYFILKYQFFILYFMAGLKKGTAEWLSGYSVQNLSEHWVFAPFRLFLTVPQTDYLVVHWFIFAFDLTVAAWMMWSRSRHVAMLLCALFHLMNSRLFRIGMFPWVCLATMPLFYPFDWPKLAVTLASEKYLTYKNKLCDLFRVIMWHSKGCQCWTNRFDDKDSDEGLTNDVTDEDEVNDDCKDVNEPNLADNTDESNDEVFTNPKSEDDCNPKKNITKSVDQTEVTNDTENYRKNCLTTYLIIAFVIIQAFLPYSHFITKGYNNWTNGLYGYSWDMMVHTWEPHSIVVKVVDNKANQEFYVDPDLFTLNDRWTRHGDMVHQYAKCLEQKLAQSGKSYTYRKIPKNISIYIDVWCSMNGRFIQRMFDPKVDLLKADWSPLQPVPYLMPLLDEALHWRTALDDIRNNVLSWSNYSDVTFIADFPGYDQEKFIPSELKNVTLTVLEGQVAFESEVTEAYKGQSTKLFVGNSTLVTSGSFHKVLNIGNQPAFYMYTYYNSSEVTEPMEPKPKLPIGSELLRRLRNMLTFGYIVVKGVAQSFYNTFECY
ncbi:vitamin K-dependent gamma-carboxylase [Ostrinia furnacalis]|uniref:vitamin K-dependent gamma-carboxylase n=1 Tax=Ostrinia furnacalis TaxID=93504 RepID=UPI001039F243|nr:vitamin K-dependent gamma-carboxylase [Ostrinia furnacalis]